MSSKIKVDTIENVAGSGNVSLGSGHNLVVPGTLNITGASTLTGGIANAGTITAGTLGSGIVYPAGHVLQTVRTEFRTYINTTSTSLASTGMAATITPRFSSSKILVNVKVNGMYMNVAGGHIQLDVYKASSSIGILTTTAAYKTSGDEASYGIYTNSYEIENSPSTTSATTYTLYWKVSSGTGYINNYNVGNTSSLSSITLQEISQ